MSLAWNRAAAVKRGVEVRAVRRHRPGAAHACAVALTGVLAALSGLWPCPADASQKFPARYSEEEIRQVLTPNEAELRKLRALEISQLRVTLGRRVPKNRQAELYFRLAELYLEGYRNEFLIEGRVHEKRLRAGDERSAIDRSRSRPFLLNGIRVCEQILALQFPYEKLDRVYYFLGYNYDELGNKASSLAYYKQLIERYPGSIYSAEAYRELGLSEFRANRFEQAKGYFESAIRISAPDSIVLPGIYHKLAWTHYRMRDTAAPETGLQTIATAIATMKRAIELALKDDERFLSIREEALRDMAIFMTETGRVDEAIRYFREVAGNKDYYPKTLANLGREFERTLQPKKAIQVYESLLKTNPDDAVTFQVTVKLVDLDLRAGNTGGAFTRIEKLKNLPSSTRDSDMETRIASQNLRAMVRRTATEKHQESRSKDGVKEGFRPGLAVAEKYYGLYLERFLAVEDPRKETPEIQMYLAEVKSALGKTDEASTLYKKIVDGGDSRYAKEAAALWVSNLLTAVKSSKNTATASAATEPSKAEAIFVEASDELATLLPGSSESNEAALRAAQILSGYSKTRADGLKRARLLVEKAPRTPQALVAARLWIQLIADRVPDPNKSDPDDYAEASGELKEVLDRLKGDTGLMEVDRAGGKGELAREIIDRERRIRLGGAIVQEREKNFKAAGREYEAFASEPGAAGEDFFAMALGAYAKGSEWDLATNVVRAWLSRFPKSARAMEGARGTATQFLIAGEFGRSAELFRELGQKYSDPSALETSARVYEGLKKEGGAEQAQAVLREFLTLYPRSERRFDVSRSLARSFEASGKDREAEKFYIICSKSPAPAMASECHARLGDLYARLKDTAAARAQYAQAAQAAPSAGPYVAYARFRQAATLESERQFQPLALPEDKLQKGLEERLKFFEVLTNAYQRAVEAQGPWATSALVRLAAWTLSFADEVDRLAPPGGLDAAGVEKFRQSVGAVNKPLRSKAIQSLTTAVAKAQDSEWYSAELPQALDLLADLGVRPAQRAQGFRGRFRLAGLPADGGELGKKKALAQVRRRLVEQPKDADAWVDYGNLLWGDERPTLARLAYDRALAVNPKHAAAANNIGVALVNAEGEDDWSRASEAADWFKLSYANEKLFIAGKFNHAALLTYYRLFGLALPLWEQVIARSRFGDAFDGLAICQHSAGKTKESLENLEKAEDYDAIDPRFAKQYHLAVSAAADTTECQSHLRPLKVQDHQGFERQALERLRKKCGWP